MNFSLIIPLWNESRNVPELIRQIAASGLPEMGMAELLLVNNGSADSTGELIDTAARQYPWVVPIHLPENKNYGGGVYEGCLRASQEVFCYIPGDLQVSPEDVIKVARTFAEHASAKEKLLVKGHRTIRHDPLQTRLVSKIFTILSNLVLGLKIRDVNGLPKMFHRSLIDLLPGERMTTFLFDAQLLSVARSNAWTILEIPVTFHGRREGVSSWSSKRMKVYIQSLRQLLRLRALRG